ncbi:FAD-binding and (Fe-S)-binding domain-containing protein [Emticicia sp. SJ17W-69]|uniref:FAD-binding and (Fe-S)-binding domain-containing protein n=1 Tax=Emticicia sp. SJ17W-69 TaxID=3421657 RepID=UPI003EBBFFFD
MFKISENATPIDNFEKLTQIFDGELFFDESFRHEALRLVYSTDASAYQEKPLAVAIPKSIGDLKHLIAFAKEQKTTLIPRAAGTSLAGQVVGNGIVVDISKNFNKILEVNQAEKWVRVQPGVIRNDLNAYLQPYGLLFGPETSTASRAMIGGMIGNNSSGLHSIVWGDTRNNLVEITALLCDGSEVVFGDLSQEQLKEKCKGETLEAKIYQEIKTLIENPENQEAIEKGFPKKEITRRNTGYALDMLLENYPLSENDVATDNIKAFNFCKLIAGSEGTLCLVTEVKLKLIDLPPKEVALVNVHCSSMRESLLVNLIALKHQCFASELMDDLVLELTKGNVEQSRNRSFVEGRPATILMVEFFAETSEVLEKKTTQFIEALKKENLGFAYPILRNADCTKAWDLRKAALGILSNQKGDFQPTNLIEDCAVSPEDLPDYIDDLEILLKKHQLQYSITAHAGAGELHVVPMMNLRTGEGKQLFRQVLAETAVLVKKYNGSLSGEHGDGRLRGEFLPFMMGEKNYELFKQVKHIFDPNNVFNRGKITDTPPMNEFLRVKQDQTKHEVVTIFDFSEQDGILRLAEKCSGSGDCRKTEITGGTMCPSYMATRQEKDTTRARANMLRHYYEELGGRSKELGVEKPLLNPNTYLLNPTKDVLDLCLSCKGCKSECPSSVDVGKMKAEFMQHYYDEHGVPLRSKLVGNFSKLMKLASFAPWSYNLIFDNKGLRKIANKIVGFHPERTMPHLSKISLNKWYKHSSVSLLNIHHPSLKKVFLFCDEFTNYNDVEIGKKLISLLQNLGYQVIIPEHIESGRSYLSKGLVREAQKIAIQNVEKLKELITSETPLIGIEPSAILTFRDEYLDLVPAELKESAQKIAKNTFLFEEWFAQEIDKGNIKKEQFTEEKRLIKLHGHCHQKSLSSLTPSKKAMSLPKNYEVHLIPSGCCGMAGSFGYEKEHYDVSMQIGELVLFPTVRKQVEETIIAAAGTSCRHQIKDGTGRIALHPIEILFDALK